MWWLANAALAQNAFEGPEIVDAISSSVEVNESLLQVLQAQSRYDQHQSYLGGTTRWAPGRFELSDGQLVAGNLARYQVAGGVGLGKPSKFGAHFGLALDGIAETGAASISYGGYQEILYFGVGVKGFQITINARVDFLAGGSGGLDPWLQFQPESGPDSYRQSLPFDQSKANTHGQTWSVYHGVTGAYAYITYDSDIIYDARVNVQPLAKILPEALGLPAAGLRWIDDRALEAFPDSTAAEPPGGFGGLEPAKKRFQTDLGVDDAATVGLRWRVVAEWVPTPAFRYAELGAVRSLGEIEGLPLGFGARAALARPDERFRVAAESFGMLGIGASKRAAYAGHVAVSYSYSVPDGTTFIPIPNAHVLGVQAVWGVPETSKPIVPIVRGFDDEGGFDADR